MPGSFIESTISTYVNHQKRGFEIFFNSFIFHSQNYVIILPTLPPPHNHQDLVVPIIGLFTIRKYLRRALLYDFVVDLGFFDKMLRENCGTAKIYIYSFFMLCLFEATSWKSFTIPFFLLGVYSE